MHYYITTIKSTVPQHFQQGHSSMQPWIVMGALQEHRAIQDVQNAQIRSDQVVMAEFPACPSEGDIGSSGRLFSPTENREG